MSKALFFAVAASGGALVALQAVANNRLRQGVGGDSLATALLSFGVGLLTLGVLMALRGGASAPLRAFADALPHLPWWALAGGLCGAGYVLSIIVGVPRIGIAWCMAGVLLGQQAGALLLDHYGIAGTGPIPVDRHRIAGLVLLAAGAWMLRPA